MKTSGLHWTLVNKPFINSGTLCTAVVKGQSQTPLTGKGADASQAAFCVYVDAQCPNEEPAFSA